MQNKGQVFMMDYILGMLMFFALAIMGVMLIIQILPNESYEQLYQENNYISQMLTGAGYPLNWTNDTVIIPGIADDYRLNLTKVYYHDIIEYEELKSYFQLTSDYLYYFENNTHILNLSNCTHGYNVTLVPGTCKPNMTTIEFDNLVRTTRLLAHNGTMVRFVIYSWN